MFVFLVGAMLLLGGCQENDVNDVETSGNVIVESESTAGKTAPTQSKIEDTTEITTESVTKTAAETDTTSDNNMTEAQKINLDKKQVDTLAVAVAISWADPTIDGEKATSFSINVVNSKEEMLENEIKDPKTFMEWIYAVAGFQNMHFESEAFKNVENVDVVIDTTTAKVTVTAFNSRVDDGNGNIVEYSVTK